MTELQINQLIHEKVMGKCLHHNRKPAGMLYACPDCRENGLGRDTPVPRYTKNWADYGPMLEECVKKDWWDDCDYYTTKWDDFYNPLRGSTAIAEFMLAHLEYFEEKEDGR